MYLELLECVWGQRREEHAQATMSMLGSEDKHPPLRIGVKAFDFECCFAGMMTTENQGRGCAVLWQLIKYHNDVILPAAGKPEWSWRVGNMENWPNHRPRQT